MTEAALAAPDGLKAPPQKRSARLLTPPEVFSPSEKRRKSKAQVAPTTGSVALAAGVVKEKALGVVLQVVKHILAAFCLN